MKNNSGTGDIERETKPTTPNRQSDYRQKTGGSGQEYIQADDNKRKLARLIAEFESLGVPHFFWTHAEARELVALIDEDEEARGVLYGYTESSFAILVATHKRILYIHKIRNKVMFQEIKYDDANYILYEEAGLFHLVTLYAHRQEYAIRTLNMRSAERFMSYVEQRVEANLARRFS